MVNDFEEIKGRLDIRAVIMDVTGIAMKGPHLESCPFCGGHECFSFPNELAYKCFQCDEPSGGDVFTFLQRYENLTPAESLARAAAIAGYQLKAKPVPGQKPVPGAEFQMMKGLGHFPMTEHPEAFLEYLRPALARLRTKTENHA